MAAGGRTTDRMDEQMFVGRIQVITIGRLVIR